MQLIMEEVAKVELAKVFLEGIQTIAFSARQFTYSSYATSRTVIAILCIEESQKVLELFVLCIGNGALFHDSFLSPLSVICSWSMESMEITSPVITP